MGCFSRFCQHLKENCLSGATGRDEACVALVARLLSALCDLSPSVKSCFVPFAIHSSSKVSPNLSQICSYCFLIRFPPRPHFCHVPHLAKNSKKGKILASDVFLQSFLGSSTAWTEMISTLQDSSKQAWIVWQELVSSQIDAEMHEKLIPDSGSLSAILSHSTPVGI